MKKNPIPYRKTVFVCTHERGAGRVACGNAGRGGRELYEELKAGVKKAELKGVRVARAGCLDLCEAGPNVFIFPDGEWLSGVSPADAPEILKKLSD